ncbi:MAG: methyltransferase domain-containing protein, partial [Sandaracinaceae bacterium]
MPFLKRIERYFSAFFKLGRTAQSAKFADRSLRQLEPRVDRLSDELFNLGERSADLDHGTNALRDRLAQIEEGQRRIEARLSAVDERIAERVDQRGDALTEAVAEVRSRQAELVEILHRDSARLDRLDGTGERIADLGRDLSDLDGRTRRDAAGLVAEMAATARAYTYLSRRLDLARFRNGEDKRASPPFPSPDRREGLDALRDAFYGRLEDRFRGARDEILERLRVYLPDVRQAVEATGGRVLDLGCGRGEWVELLTREAIAAEGVGLTPVQISEALALGLEVREGDALRTLAEAPDNHYAAVTAHHLVEHLSFDTVTWMTREALRVLAPGGVLSYETPNPRNLIVGATTFNIDPTHR